MIKVGRNDPCPCGSGKKYKKCCAQKSPLQRHTFTNLTTQGLQNKVSGMVNQTINKAEEPKSSLQDRLSQGSPENKENSNLS